MGTLLLNIALLALACALCSEAGAERRGPRPMMAVMPTLEEMRQQLLESRRHSDPLRRFPAAPAPAGMGRRHKPASAAGVVLPLEDRPGLQRPATEREQQPDIAGRVAMAAHPGLRITNSNKASAGQFPWQAGVLQEVSGTQYWCGGSILSSSWILTAAQCLDHGPPYYLVSVGSLKSQNGKEASLQTRKSTEAFQHPDYNPYYMDNDIGLIRVPTPFTLGDYVRPIRLPPYSLASDMLVGKQGTVSGWGRTSDGTGISEDLMYTQTTIDDGSACSSLYGSAWIPNKICDRTLYQTSFCSGDSGDPLVYEETPGVWTQIGIVSYGDGSKQGCNKNLPAVYTRLATFLQFVEDTTNIAIRD